MRFGSSAMLTKGVLVLSTLAIVSLALEDSFEKLGSPKKLGIDPGPLVKSSRGEVWPKPQNKKTGTKFFIVRPKVFQFKVTAETCPLLEGALVRYKQDLQSQEKTRRAARISFRRSAKNLTTEEQFQGYLDQVLVKLGMPCHNETWPSDNMDEHYEIRLNTEDSRKACEIVSESVWGMLRGLETWSQLVYSSSDAQALIVNETFIQDFPRFPHRGLLVDTSRHFLPLRTLFSMIDGMVASKLNVLHWHVVDDQSFPFQSETFPELSNKGAYAPTHVYTPSNVRSVVTYARDRGVRVVPEFDTPGHTRSWGQGYPDLLVACYQNNRPDGSFGPMNPIANGTYDFMRKLLPELKRSFPDNLIHLGGDEVDFACWYSNPELNEVMTENGWTPKILEGKYVGKIIEMAKNLWGSWAVWQEIVDNGATLPGETLVHVWKQDHKSELNKVTRKGYKALLSSCWYLDGLKSGGDWDRFYTCDPLDFPGNDEQKRLVMGGEACMWGEVVDSNNALSRVWPRAAAAAERLWSAAAVNDVDEAAKRLEEHTCRMNRRKIPAQPPNGAGFCPGLNYY